MEIGKGPDFGFRGLRVSAFGNQVVQGGIFVFRLTSCLGSFHLWLQEGEVLVHILGQDIIFPLAVFMLAAFAHRILARTRILREMNAAQHPSGALLFLELVSVLFLGLLAEENLVHRPYLIQKGKLAFLLSVGHPEIQRDLFQLFAFFAERGRKGLFRALHLVVFGQIVLLLGLGVFLPVASVFLGISFFLSLVIPQGNSLGEGVCISVLRVWLLTPGLVFGLGEVAGLGNEGNLWLLSLLHQFQVVVGEGESLLKQFFESLFWSRPLGCHITTINFTGKREPFNEEEQRGG